MANSHAMKLKKPKKGEVNPVVKKNCAKKERKKKAKCVPVRKVPFNPSSLLHPVFLTLPLGSTL